MSNSILSDDEIIQLSLVKAEHRPYWDALILSSSIITSRNRKYTGEDVERDVFKNFHVDARIQGITTRAAFIQWICKKLARILINDGDYADERYVDSIRDLANYTLLLLGFELHNDRTVGGSE